MTQAGNEMALLISRTDDCADEHAPTTSDNLEQGILKKSSQSRNFWLFTVVHRCSPVALPSSCLHMEASKIRGTDKSMRSSGGMPAMRQDPIVKDQVFTWISKWFALIYRRCSSISTSGWYSKPGPSASLGHSENYWKVISCCEAKK